MNKEKILRFGPALIFGWLLSIASPVLFENGSAWAQGKSSGAKLYETHCGNCHPAGGNVLNPALPVVGSSHLKTVEAFTKFNRQPVKPDGSRGIMPAFPKEKISDADMKLLYDYVKQLPPLKK